MYTFTHVKEYSKELSQGYGRRVLHVTAMGRDKQEIQNLGSRTVAKWSVCVARRWDSIYMNRVGICILTLSSHMFSTGVTEMLLSVWDLRQSNPIWSLKEMDDYVSCMVTTEAQKYLVCTSGEGTVTCIDLRNRRLHLQARFEFK